MPRDSTRREPGIIFIPQSRYRVTWKVEVNGTDVTEYVLALDVEHSIGRLATCNLTLSNPYGKWLNYWDGGETVVVHAEYGTGTPTNKIFSGKIDNPYFTFGRDGYKMVIEARQTPEVADKKIVTQFDSKNIADAIKAIIDDDYSSILTYNNVEATTETYTGNFQHTSGIDALNALAVAASMDLYIDTDNDVHLFVRDSNQKTDDYVAFNNNLKGVSKYGKDTSNIFNRVTVYGKEDQNVILLKTEEDTASQSDLWVKDLIVSANSLETMTDVQEKTNVGLTNGTNVEEDGSVTILGMPTISPGDSVMMQIPFCGIEGYKNVRGFTHSINTSGFNTSLQITDTQDDVSEIFRERIDAEERLSVYSNLNDMRDSYTIFFNEDPAAVTLNNVEIVDKSVKLESGKSNGTCSASILNTDNLVTQCELRIITNFPNQELCIFEVSNDGGTTYEYISPGTLHTFSSTGSRLTYRINFVGDATHDPVFESMCLLYK